MNVKLLELMATVNTQSSATTCAGFKEFWSWSVKKLWPQEAATHKGFYWAAPGYCCTREEALTVWVSSVWDKMAQGPPPEVEGSKGPPWRRGGQRGGLHVREMLLSSMVGCLCLEGHSSLWSYTPKALSYQWPVDAGWGLVGYAKQSGSKWLKYLVV